MLLSAPKEGVVGWAVKAPGPLFSQTVSGRPAPLPTVGHLAAMHHERMDGSGHHRGDRGHDAARARPCACRRHAYHAMTQRRPHRPAFTATDAARELR
ncbi:MAG: hypothetical protein ACRD2W_12345 [Acidimicrobiales bacterium]